MAVDFSNIISTLFLSFLLSIFVVTATENETRVCPGPTRYYKELGCTPVFNNTESRCPIRYNCDHLKNLASDKCYINGHVYNRNERVRREDIVDPCATCRCSGPAFLCMMPGCVGPNAGCYHKMTPFQCCGSEVCPGFFTHIPTCVVDGKTYKDGEYFTPSANPEKRCYCGEGYTGENVEPFCRGPELVSCNNLLYNGHAVRQNCVPYYSFAASLEKDCNEYLRCPVDGDAVIRRPTEVSTPETSEPEDPNMMCTFGNLRMRIGDELNQDTSYHSTCMKCVCEVPPVPTCRKRSPEECNEPNQRKK